MIDVLDFISPFEGGFKVTRDYLTHIKITGADTAGQDMIPLDRPAKDAEELCVYNGFWTPWTESSTGNIGGNLQLSNGYVVKYNHMSKHIAPKGYVIQGQVLGLCGATGNAKGEHLCFAIQTNPATNTRTDPAPFFENYLNLSNNEDMKFNNGVRAIITAQSINDPKNSIMGAYAGTVGIIKQGPRYIDGIPYYDMECLNGTGFVRADHLGLTEQPVNNIGINYELINKNNSEKVISLTAELNAITEEYNTLKSKYDILLEENNNPTEVEDNSPETENNIITENWFIKLLKQLFNKN